MLPYYGNEGKFCPRGLSGTPGPGKVTFQKMKYIEKKNWEARTRQETGPQGGWDGEVGGASVNGFATLHSGPAFFLGSRNGGLRKVFAYGSDMLIIDF